MKSLTTRMMIAAAAFVAVAGVASAQTMEAKIPFAFRAGGQVFAAGTYRVHVKTGLSPYVVISGSETGQQAISFAYSGDIKKAWLDSGDAVLSFQCGVGRCALADLWLGDTKPAYHLNVPKLGKDEPRKTAEIVMHPVAD